MNDTPQQDDEQIKKLEQDIRGMFKLEAQRNKLNYALSGVERSAMTIQDYEDDLSVAIANWFFKDLLPIHSAEAYKAGVEAGRKLDLRLSTDIQEAYEAAQRDKALAVLNAIIDELKKQEAHYNLKGGHLLLYERNGVNVYLGDRLAELEAQKAKLKGETDA